MVSIPRHKSFISRSLIFSQKNGLGYRIKSNLSIHLLGSTSVDLLAVALGNNLNETLLSELADGGAGKAAVDLQNLKI